jgi:glycine betaine/choline ABC-type transport system substrate-binding protein
MRHRNILSVLSTIAVAGTLAACGSSNSNDTTASAPATTTASTSTAAPASAGGKLIVKNPANASKPQLTIGSKNFTEEFILGEVYAQALQAAGYKVKKQLNLGSEQIAYKALKGGQVDAYPEYVGTALTNFFKVKSADVPKAPAKAYEQAKAQFAKAGVTALPLTPFTDSNGFAMSQAGWKKAGSPKTLSELAPKFGQLTLSGSPECRSRLDCKLGVEQTYGQKFKKYLPVDLAKRHEVLTSGQADVSVVFTTDGQIAADKLVLLQDDKQFLPPYNVSFLVRDAALKAAGPDFAKVIASVQEGLTTPVVQELNSRVDLDKQKPEAVAAAYLKESGYVK